MDEQRENMQNGMIENETTGEQKPDGGKERRRRGMGGGILLGICGTLVVGALASVENAGKIGAALPEVRYSSPMQRQIRTERPCWMQRQRQRSTNCQLTLICIIMKIPMFRI